MRPGLAGVSAHAREVWNWIAIKRAHELQAFMEGVPYKRYAKGRPDR
jgi:hypothetical protein